MSYLLTVPHHRQYLLQSMKGQLELLHNEGNHQFCTETQYVEHEVGNNGGEESYTVSKRGCHVITTLNHTSFS